MPGKRSHRIDLSTLGPDARHQVEEALRRPAVAIKVPRGKSLAIPQETKIPASFWVSMVGQAPVAEYRFKTGRRWRIDYAWPDLMLAVEIEGGIWSEGRHTRGQGFRGDIEKYNTMAEAGWTLLRYEPRRIDYAQIKRVMDICIAGQARF